MYCFMPDWPLNLTWRSLMHCSLLFNRTLENFLLKKSMFLVWMHGQFYYPRSCQWSGDFGEIGQNDFEPWCFEFCNFWYQYSAIVSNLFISNLCSYSNKSFHFFCNNFIKILPCCWMLLLRLDLVTIILLSLSRPVTSSKIFIGDAFSGNWGLISDTS